MCVIHNKTAVFKGQSEFKSGVRAEIPSNSFVLEFFTQQLLPFTGKKAPLRLLSNALEVSWRIFIYKNMHYANSASEFVLPLFAYELMADPVEAGEFVVYFLRRITALRNSPSKSRSIEELEDMYQQVLTQLKELNAPE